MRPDGFVLAGGRSTRMGFDKARVSWGGVPLAIAVHASLEAVCGRVALVRRGAADGLPWARRDGTDVEVLREADEGDTHPLNGVVTALEAARTDVALVVPCDVPGLSATTLRALIRAAPAVAHDGQRRHPLVGVFPVAWLGRARTLAASGGSVHAFAEGAEEVRVDPAELVNLNDRAALGPGPIRALLARLPFLDPGEAARVAEGERGRLLARGMLDVPWAPDEEGS